MLIYPKKPTPKFDSLVTSSDPISLVVFCVDKSSSNTQYKYLNSINDSIDVVSRSLRCQVDIHQLFKIPNLVILTNFDFSYKGVTAINMPDALCKNNSYGNKYTLPYQYLKETNIKQDIWLHDYDCFPQLKFNYPTLMKNQIGGVLTKPKYVNSGSLFIKKDDLDFFETFKRIYDITNYHKFDEFLLNDLLFNRRHIIDKYKDKRVVEIFKGFKKEICSLGVEYNYSNSMAKRVKKLDFTPLAIHFHPEKPEQHQCFEGKNIIKEELNKIFLEHCPLEYRNRNLALYTKWRYPK
jgi:hypothetical protein